ncbi:hypothetical protein BGZ94_001497 [Podila epigama]|nr:hypothetical protein BGZ94_001497 [Podila epigama]
MTPLEQSLGITVPTQHTNNHSSSSKSSIDLSRTSHAKSTSTNNVHATPVEQPIVSTFSTFNSTPSNTTTATTATTATVASGVSFSQSTITPPSPPNSLTPNSHSPSTSSNKQFQRNPSIRVHKDKKENERDRSKDRKDKDKDKDKDNVREQRKSTIDPHTKIALKRSRSPIKLLKNIRSYLHVHKHRFSSGISHNTNSSNSNSNGFGSSLAPPTSTTFSHNNHRATALPSSSILSPNLSGQSSTLNGGLPAAATRPPRERQPSESLDSEQQVLLLRVMSYFEHAGHHADEETAEYLLTSYQWDINLTLQYCQDLIDAVHGTLHPVQQEIQLNGAVNDQMTSCYIDALLFAMFARLSAFEGLLNVNLDGDSDSGSDSDTSGDHPTTTTKESKKTSEKQEMLLCTHRLQTWLRMFVNQLRSGKLVQAHVVKELRQHLYCCGWHCPGPMDPPGSSRQEDASELFMFLTEKLHLPYLPLEQRLLHGARISEDDDKVITERMLQISFPTQEQEQQNNLGASLLLRNDGSTSTSKPPKESAFSKFLGKASSSSSSSSTSQNGSMNGGDKSTNGSASTLHDVLSLENLLAQHFYDNTLTGIRRKVSAGTGAPLSPGVEVPVSAWQVLELLPFYASTNEQGGEVYANQSQYPSDVVILPLILKRYSFGPDMRPRRIGTPVDIPRRIDFSRFVNPQTPPTSSSAATKATAAAGTASETPCEVVKTVELAEPDLSQAAAPTVFSEPVQEDPSISRNRPSTNTTANVSTFGASASMQAISAATSPTPHLSEKTIPSRINTQFLELTDNEKKWSHPPAQTDRDYLDCHPKVKYVLELKSVVCHLGSQLNSGHYRSYVADSAPKVSTTATPYSSLSSSSSSSLSPSTLPPVQEPNWLRHDDLDPSGHRVKLIERDSVENMDMESDWARNGYILFYELQAIPLS